MQKCNNLIQVVNANRTSNKSNKRQPSAGVELTSYGFKCSCHIVSSVSCSSGHEGLLILLVTFGELPFSIMSGCLHLTSHPSSSSSSSSPPSSSSSFPSSAPPPSLSLLIDSSSSSMLRKKLLCKDSLRLW